MTPDLFPDMRNKVEPDAPLQSTTPVESPPIYSLSLNAFTFTLPTTNASDNAAVYPVAPGVAHAERPPVGGVAAQDDNVAPGPVAPPTHQETRKRTRHSAIPPWAVREHGVVISPTPPQQTTPRYTNVGDLNRLPSWGGKEGFEASLKAWREKEAKAAKAKREEESKAAEADKAERDEEAFWKSLRDKEAQLEAEKAKVAAEAEAQEAEKAAAGETRVKELLAEMEASKRPKPRHPDHTNHSNQRPAYGTAPNGSRSSDSDRGAVNSRRGYRYVSGADSNHHSSATPSYLQPTQASRYREIQYSDRPRPRHEVDSYRPARPSRLAEGSKREPTSRHNPRTTTVAAAPLPPPTERSERKVRSARDVDKPNVEKTAPLARPSERSGREHSFAQPTKASAARNAGAQEFRVEKAASAVKAPVGKATKKETAVTGVKTKAKTSRPANTKAKPEPAHEARQIERTASKTAAKKEQARSKNTEPVTESRTLRKENSVTAKSKTTKEKVRGKKTAPVAESKKRHIELSDSDSDSDSDGDVSLHASIGARADNKWAPKPSNRSKAQQPVGKGVRSKRPKSDRGEDSDDDDHVSKKARVEAKPAPRPKAQQSVRKGVSRVPTAAEKRKKDKESKGNRAQLKNDEAAPKAASTRNGCGKAKATKSTSDDMDETSESEEHRPGVARVIKRKRSPESSDESDDSEDSEDDFIVDDVPNTYKPRKKAKTGARNARKFVKD